MRLPAAALAALVLLPALPLAPAVPAQGDDGIPLLGNPTRLRIDGAGHLLVRILHPMEVPPIFAPADAGNVAVFLSGPSRFGWVRAPDFTWPSWGFQPLLQPGVYHLYAFADRPTTITILGGYPEGNELTLDPYPRADLLPQTLLGSGVEAPAGTPVIPDRARFEAPARSVVVTFERLRLLTLGAATVLTKHHVQGGPDGLADCQAGYSAVHVSPLLIEQWRYSRYRWVVDPGTWEVGSDLVATGAAVVLQKSDFTVRFQQAPGDSEALWQNPGWPLLGAGPYVDEVVPDEVEAVVEPVACTAVPGVP